MPGLTEKIISRLKGRNAMPLANYCRKCKAEVPVGESCPYCGAKLTKTVVEALRAQGCLDGMDESSQMTLF